MKRTPDAAVTSLPRAPRDEERGRVRHYVITMGIRVVCFLLMFLVQPFGWWTWVFGIAAAVLPYIAVVTANAGGDSVETALESPQQGIGAAPTTPPTAPATPRIITLNESAVSAHGTESHP
ncbi:DUF3099 domain-containing protein [Microbacterium capsulatum]|uniref:DUF3099 domain-containing protein n=1 Tax=Microbacterium capsulatum TaxID=3041921 RepID=A0ABU0XEI3_9MICO|nr:DUF3099 domain-containing protein [Microbacterium sp. ASV81]MDQ4213337.1 DUF3099 domain-containing protein [Microbacterium sp. ASV81]